MTKLLSIFIAVLLFYSCFDKTKNKMAENTAETGIPAPIVISSAFGNGRIESEFKVVRLASPSTGIITDIVKGENESVKKGTVLAEMEKSTEDAEVEKVRARIRKAMAQNTYDMLEIHEVEKQVSNAARVANRSKALVDLEAETQEDYDAASLNYELKRSELDKARTKRAITKNELEALHAELKVATATRDRKNIIAPADGRILEWQISSGEGTQSTSTIAQFAPEGELIAVCEIDELLADKLQTGQKAIVRTQDGKQVIGEGRLYFLSDFLNSKSIFGNSSSEAVDRRVRTVKISFKEQPNLLINSRVQCEIILGSIKS